MEDSTKKKATAGGAVALIAAATGLFTAVHGTHTTTTAVSRNDTPVVINRPHDVNGSPLPVTITQPPGGGPPIVIVGAGPPACFLGGTQDKALPDPKCTPGAVRVVDVQTVCTPGTAADARNVTTAAKKKVLHDYGYDTTFKGEIDHLISLQLGGSNDVKNLWPEEGKVPNAKDATENRLHAWVCRKPSLTRLHAAQRAIARDWTTAERIITP